MARFPYPLNAIVSILVLFSMIRSGLGVGRARQKHQVPLPQTSGHPEFERAFRAHANNAEQVPLFFAMSWLFCVISDSDSLAALLGIVWVVVRFQYVTAYQAGVGCQGGPPGHLGKYTVPAYLVLQAYAFGIIGLLVYQAATEP